MDPLMSLRNTYPADTAAEFHSSGVDFFSNQGSSLPSTSYGQQFSVNPQGGNQSAYSLSADPQHGHSIAQSYQPNMSEGQMGSSFMYQNQQQPLPDNFYTFPTPVLYQQKHQPATNQLIQQSPASPCHSQTYSVSLHQNQNSQFASLPGHPQSPQMSPRHFAQHQAPQMMAYSQKNQQITSSPNQQRQTSPLVSSSASAQLQRLNQSPKQVVSKQRNNSKDRTSEAQFYSHQILQRNDSAVSGVHKSQASVRKFAHTAQSAQLSHTGGTNPDNRVNGDSQLRNHQGSHYGNSMKVQSKHNVYASLSSFEHINTSGPSNPQPGRYESILNTSQRIQKESPGKPGASHVPEVTKNRKYSTNFIPPGYNGNCPSSSKTPPNRPSPDPSSGAFAFVQNMHYKPRNPSDASLDNRDSEKNISRNVSTRSARPFPGGPEHLESHSNNFLYSNSYALPSIAALMESTRESGRQNKVTENINTRSNKSNGQISTAHKSTSETVSPVYWFKNPDPSLASSFQSDIEAMQADIDSYAVSNRMSKATVRDSPVSHNVTVHKPTESQVSSPSGLKKAAHMSEIKKAGNVSRVEQQPNAVSSPDKVRLSKADALAAIQIKQELVESISKYKSASPNSTAGNSSSTKTALQTSAVKSGIVPSARDVSVLINQLPSGVKAPTESIPSQQQLDLNARRHSSSETNKARQSVSASPNSFVHSTQKHSKTSEYGPEAAATSYLRHQSMLDLTIQSGQQIIQTRRNTTPSSLDRSSGGIYTASYPPNERQNSVYTTAYPSERQNMDMYISHVGAQGMASQSHPGQNSIHHLVEQVQNINVPHPHVRQQQNIAPVTKNKQGDGAVGVDKTRQGQSKPVELTVNVKQPPLCATLSNGTLQQTAPAKNTVVKMEQSDNTRKSINTACYVMLHDFKLICLKSSSETLLLLCQFQMCCFPDRSLENVNICIDHTLQIKRKLLSLQDTDKVVLFLKKNGFHLGNMLQTITLNDARRVYHHLYGITNCTHSSCIAEILLSEVDQNTEVSSLNTSSARKELKNETSSDDSSCGQFVLARPPETNITTRREDFLNTVNYNDPKPVNSQMSTSLQHLSKDNRKTNPKVAFEKEVDSDDSDDLILVEASEDPHIIRWSGNAPKVGGICNTIIGQLRSYVHENERFLVVDDLCRVFGTTDFYDGVEKENIILYSCCQQIAPFLNAMHKSFPPLQSQHHSLVKEKDIGIHIIDSNCAPGGNDFEMDKMGKTLKRFLCKQEIVDDDCSSAKQLKITDRALVLESDKRQSTAVGQPLLNQHQSEEIRKDLSSSGLQIPVVNEQQSLNKLVLKMEERNRMVQCSEDEASDSYEVTSQSFLFNESQSQVVHFERDQINSSSSPLVLHVQIMQDASVDNVYSSEGIVNDIPPSDSLKETAETRLNSQPVSQINQQTTETRLDNQPVSQINQQTTETRLDNQPVSEINQQTPETRLNNQPVSEINQQTPETRLNNQPFSQINQQTSETRLDNQTVSQINPETFEPRLSNQPVSQINHVAFESEEQSEFISGASGIMTSIANSPTGVVDTSILQPGQSSSPESPRHADTAEDIIPALTDEQNSTGLLLTINQGENKQPHHETSSLTKEAGGNTGDRRSSPPSVQNSHESLSEVNNHEQGKVVEKNHSEASVNKETEDVKFSPLSSFEDLIESNPTSSILKKRVEKLKYIFETRRNKNLPLPRITLDSRLNLHLFTSDDIGSEDRRNSPSTSASYLSLETSGSIDSASVCSDSGSIDSAIECSGSRGKRLHDSSDTSCVNSSVISAGHGQGQDSAVISFLEKSKSSVVTSLNETGRSDVMMSCHPSLSAEQQTSVLPQEEHRYSLDPPRPDTVVTPLAKYFRKSCWSLDDSDIMFSKNIDPLDILPSQCWKEYSKLFQEHRALQGRVGQLLKSIAHLKADKEKSTKVTKYYEGVINDITSTIKCGDEDTPVVIDDD